MIDLGKTMVFGAVAIMFICGTGCRSVKAPATANEIWVPAERERTSKSVDPVWTSIREQHIDTSKPMVLAELIDVALHNNQNTYEAWNNARAAESVVKQARSRYYPQVSVAGNVTRERTVADEKSLELNDVNYGPNGTLTWLLLDLGGRSAVVDKTIEQLLAANFQFNQAIQDLLLDVENNYYQLHSAQLTVEAVETDVKDAKTTLDSAKQKLTAGLGIQLDVLEAKADYDKTLYSLESAKGQVKTQKANLAQSLGVRADMDFKISVPTGDLPEEINEDDVNRLIEKAITNRPDVAALRANLKAYEAAVRAANSDLWPSLSLGGSAQKLWYDLRDIDPSNQDTYGYAGYLSIEWSIFDGFYNLSVKRAAQASAEAQRAGLKQAEIEVSADVWIKYYEFKTAVQQLKYGKTYFNSSKEAYEAAQAGYKAGLKSILDVLSSQTKLSEARRTLITAEKTIFTALADLAHATGSRYVKQEKNSAPAARK